MFEHIYVPKPLSEGTGILSEVFHAAMTASSPAAATHTLMAALGTMFGAKRAYIYELPPEESEFACTVEWCAPGVEPMSDVTHGLTMTMAARWFGDGEDRSLLAIRDVQKLAEVSPEYAAQFGPRAMQAQVLGKLMRGNRPMGTLGFDDPDPQRFDELCSLMYPTCAFATSTINTRNLLGRMRNAGVVDKLTGAGTRMGFHQKAEAFPPDGSMGMAYLDVVGLQGVNDMRGHDAGDELLIAIRQVLTSEFQDDQVFRVAGDEFLVAVQGAQKHPFREAMERIRTRLDELTVYVAMGYDWQQTLGVEYDSLLRHAWLLCSNNKREWERRGGKRLGERADVLRMSDAMDSLTHSKADTQLDIPCYHNEEFFRRAHIWLEHLETNRVGVAAFDINYFKLYNDINGREAGDLLLETYGQVISRLATISHGIAGYLGGDNFCIAFPVTDDVNVEVLAQQMKTQVTMHAVAEGFSPAIGVVVTDDTASGMTILYDRALVALQDVKGDYTNHIAFYDEDRFEHERKNQLLLIEAQEGLSKGEFTFYLQPKVDITTNKVVSAEALVRWIHDGKVVPPYEFIGLMERSGYIFALDCFVWEAVCKWQRSLLDRGITPVPVSVNVSRVDFYFTDLADHFLKLINRYDLPPQLVGIEVTESAYSKDIDLVNDVIRRMQSKGFMVFMDDFGSGYSSLNMLRSVAVDVLKMDRGFISNATIHDGRDNIIDNVIKMAHAMGLLVISEGVETEEQCDSLRCMGCDYVQGFYYYRPMTIEAFEKLLRSGEAVQLDHSESLLMSLTGKVS